MKKYVIVFVFALLAVVSCVDSVSTRALDKADEIMNEDPYEALVLLDSLAGSKVRGRAAHARLSLLLSMALDKNMVDTSDISIILPAVNYYEEHGGTLDKARTYFYYGRVLQNGGDEEGALEAMSKAEIYAGQTSDLYLCGLIADAVGRIYDDNDEVPTALEYYDKALACFDSIGNRRNKVFMLDIISRACLKTGDDDESVEYARKALGEAIGLKDTAVIVSMAVSLSDAYFVTGDLESASELVGDVSEEYCGGHVPPELNVILCRMSLESGNVRDAGHYAECVMEAYDEGEVPAGVYGLLYEVAHESGNHEAACRYLMGFINALDEENRLSVEESVYAADMRYKNRELLEIVKDKNRRIRNMLVICSLSVAALIAAAVSVVQTRRRKLHEKDAEIRDYRNKIIAMQEYCDKLESVKDSLPGKDTIISEQIGIVKELMDVLVHSREEMKASSYARFKNLTDRGEKGTHAVLGIFLNSFESRYPGVRRLLESRYPDLTVNDIDLYELIGLGCSTSVIAYVCNTSESYIYNRRMSLRRKLSLPDDRNAFAVHLSGICSLS